MAGIRLFDPAAVARRETAGWSAYYARRWPRAFWEVARLNRAQFGLGWPAALAGALDIVRASRAFVPRDHDLARVRRHLEGFYRRAAPSLGSPASAARLAQLELDYWVVHRELAEARKVGADAGDPEPMVLALADLHAALFASDPAAMRPSAAERARAALAVDRITSGRSSDVAADWREVEEALRQAYEAVLAAL